MPVGLLTLELHIPDAQSLKDKRQVLRSLKDKLRRDFNVAVAELEHHDTWQRSVVGIVTISNDEKHLREVLQKVLDEADRILIETDSPFLAPVPNRGKRNEPSFVLDTARKLAEIRSLTPDATGQLTAENFYRFFRLPIPA